MLKLIGMLMIALNAYGQGAAITVTVSPASVAPGATAVVTVTYAPGATPGIIAVQDTISMGTLTAGIYTPGVAAAGKQLSTNGAAAIVVGINAQQQALIPAGVLYTFAITPPIAGTFSLNATAMAAADAAGSSVIVTAGPAATLTVVAPCIATDLNCDGITNNVDFGLAINQALGIIACTTGDITGALAGSPKDGKCDVFDVVKVAKAVPGP